MIGIALRVAVVSAALVIAIIVLVVAYVLWQLTPNQLHERPGPTDVHIYLDTIDLSIAVIGVGGLAIVLAGVAAWLIARRAVRPIAEAARMQRTFVADASHELRTPLTVLNARVQRLQRMTPIDDRRRHVVEELREDTQILIDIVNDLLEAAAGSTDPDGSADLRAAMDSAHRDMDVLAAERGVTLEVEPIDARLRVSPTQLRRCLVALTDNAIGHTPPGGHVRVTATTTATRTTIRVEDDGPGIVGIRPARVFDRFAHGTSAGTATTNTRTGYGIGLALVRDIAVRAGGDAVVEHTNSSGTVFALHLPTAPDSDFEHDPEDRA
ncbi:HAMP domain-containing sensor histidine kinase [Curtobacterium sp. RHCJP20]|uniref:Sensor-like histidine kinase SenX3 n=1 Tax=Curtobacterium subtropicum TaxID=3055138 RepID=A0ABT7TK93_9MICO|nr:HAMP domain-containing sensor histidine kinase [Curtobacterium subtropicum]MDM7890002.1 HAMP domain-containing sensor histidine kinase [Curtobacterium subtropicum]